MIVASDHGFSLRDYNVNVTQALINAGLKASANSDDVIVSNTGVALIHVKSRDPVKIRAIAELLKTQPWAASIYTAAEAPVGGAYVKSPGDEHAATVEPYGFVPGTFSLELIHQSNPERGADVIVSFPWSSQPNAYGVPGRAAYPGGGTTGPVTRPRLRARLDEPVGHPQHADGVGAGVSGAASATSRRATPTSRRPCCGWRASR